MTAKKKNAAKTAAKKAAPKAKWTLPKTQDPKKVVLLSEAKGKRIVAKVKAGESRCIEGSWRYKALDFLNKRGAKGAKVEEFAEHFPSTVIAVLTARGQATIH